MSITIENLPFTPDGALRTAGEHGRYYDAVARGNCFVQATTPIGLAVPIFTGTAPRVALFNPMGSGVNCSLLHMSNNRVSGSTVPYAAGLMRVENVGAGPATGAEVTVFGASDPFNALIGGGNKSKVISTASGTVTTSSGVATDFFYSLYHSYASVDASTGSPVQNNHDFEGRVVVPPGVMIYLAADVASVALVASALMWEEVPI